MKKSISVGVVLVISLFLAGCQNSQNIAPSAEVSPNTPAAANKTGDSTKTGKVTKAGDKYYLQQTGQATVELDSYSVDLSQYVDQTITVTGQYSGDTLFVGKVE